MLIHTIIISIIIFQDAAQEGVECIAPAEITKLQLKELSRLGAGVYGTDREGG